MAQFEDGTPKQVLPPALAEHVSEIDDFQKYCTNLVLKILTLFDLGLEVLLPVYLTSSLYLPSLTSSPFSFASPLPLALSLSYYRTCPQIPNPP
jgi:hypothetical protein